MYADDADFLTPDVKSLELIFQTCETFQILFWFMEWFIDNKLSVHFGEEKTKSILFGTYLELFVSELEEGHANQSSQANQSNQSNHEA